jgi:ATP synthase protein I
MSTDEREEEPFVREIRRQVERAQVSQHLTFWQGLSLVGSVGWMVVLPTLIGAFLGRWVDAGAGTGVFWTLSLLFIGLVTGCAAAWRHVAEGFHR